MDWNQIVDKITPYIVKIDTPDGHGTGFLCLYNENKTMCGIATAHHVVEHADEWQQPIRIKQPSSSTSFLAKEADRVIIANPDKDSAVVLLFQNQLKFPEDLIPLLPNERVLPIGVEVAWLGYPSIDPNTLCFFSGNVSARKNSSYLIDGVAINGVSGGPVMFSTPTDGIQIVGNISAYMPNYRSNSTALPGLCVAQDVSHFTNIGKMIKSQDEARRKKTAILEEESKASPPPPSPLPPPND